MPTEPLSPDSVPAFFKCPISLALMRDPVSLCTGVTYDRSSIETWLEQGHNTCPATMRVLEDQQLTPNHTLRRLIQQWCVGNPSYGIEQIPAPKPPVEPRQVRLLSAKLTDAASTPSEKLEALQQLRSLSKESERSKRCIKATLSTDPLVDLIKSEAASRSPNLEIAQESLGLLTLFSLEAASKQILLDPPQLRLIARLLLRGTLDARVNAAQLIECLSVDRSAKARVGASDEIIQGLIILLKEDNDQLYPTAVKASLKALLSLSQTLRNRVKVVEFDNNSVVTALVELLPGAERGMAERVMAVLDTLSSCAEGRAAITAHALAIPSVIRCLLVVSEMATEHAVGVLWSVCINSSEEEILQEALQLGVLKKLLVVVQMAGFNQRTIQQSKDLLRLFSNFSGNHHCSSEEI